MPTPIAPSNEPDIESFVNDYETAGQADVRATLESYRDELRAAYASLVPAPAPTTPNTQATPATPNTQAAPEANNTTPLTVGQQIAAAREQFNQQMDLIERNALAEHANHQHRVSDVQYSPKDTARATKIALGSGAGLATAEALLGASVGGALSTGIVGSLGVGALYGMGRLEGKLWNRDKAGFGENLARGAAGVVTIPAWAAMHSGKYLLKDGVKGIGNNIAAIPKMLKGESKPVKYATAPLWAPFRGSYRFMKGIGQGVMKSGNPKGAGKIGSFLGKIIRSPKDIYDYAMSPAK